MEADRKYHYPGQNDDEVVKRIAYRHWAYLLPAFGLAITMLAVVAFLVVYTWTASTSSGEMKINLTMIAIFLMLFTVGFMLASIWIWHNNKIIITNQNLVEVEQKSLFNKSISTLRLVNIQDVSADVSGPFQSALGYGTVTVQSAGEKRNFIFQYVPQAYELKDYISDLHLYAATDQGDKLIDR
ncbi:PH domain-containing protein [Candidatus Saccharibacteria bacterium]|nr:PH domain-containing protein [Candidatus Saccharibacteria bacterium]